MTTKAEKMEALQDAIGAARERKDADRLATLIEEAKQYNFCAKTVKPAQAYEVWTNYDWTWLVLKKYAAPVNEEKDSYARWLCLVDGAALEIGDVYVRDIKKSAVQLIGEAAEQARTKIAALYRY